VAYPCGKAPPVIGNDVPVHHGLCSSALADVAPVVVGPFLNEPVASESEIYAHATVRTMPMMIPKKTRMVYSLQGRPRALATGTTSDGADGSRGGAAKSGSMSARCALDR
jgi:hypothetical protein